MTEEDRWILIEAMRIVEDEIARLEHAAATLRRCQALNLLGAPGIGVTDASPSYLAPVAEQADAADLKSAPDAGCQFESGREHGRDVNYWPQPEPNVHILADGSLQIDPPRADA